MRGLRSGDSATWAAEHFIDELGITELPVDPIAIARGLDIDVYAKSASEKGVSGMLIRYENNFAIAYSTHIDNEGFQRFSVGHEIGHYKLPGHVEQLFADGRTTHISHAGFVTDDPYELEADHFSAGLLMPEKLFANELRNADDGLDAVEHLAGICKTSREATAIRYSEMTDTLAAVIMSTGQTIDYCFMSKPLKEVKGLEWIRKGQPVPSGTATERFNAVPTNVARALRTDDSTTLSDWFGGDCDAEFYEEVTGLGSYGKTLTVLYAPEDLDLEDAEEDDDLEASYEVRFRKR